MRHLVLGLGESGLAIARWLARDGAQLRIADTRAEPPMLAALRMHLPDAEFVGGPFGDVLLDDVQGIALSPGLSPTTAPAAALLAAAKRRGIEIVGEIELFACALARLRDDRGHRPKVIGVTGTNGKTTTTRLAGLLIERAGRRVAVAGNISPTALDTLRERLDADDLPEVWVLELSSFQLATTKSLVCDAAAVLNVTQDHLDWHGTMDAYAKAKARIFSKGTVQVLNRDDPLVMAMARKGAPVCTFGQGAPVRADEYGLMRDGGLTWLALADEVSAPRRRRPVAPRGDPAHSEAQAPDPDSVPAAVMPEPVTAPMFEVPQVHVSRLMPTEALKLRGRHNALNVLAALALARAIDCPLAPMLHALRSYRGEPHRVALVATIGGVDYYDDSKGTNVGATVAAIEGLGAEGKRLLVILGGDGKGQDFAPLAASLARHARAIALIGRDAQRIADALAGAPYPIERCVTLNDAVRVCRDLAHPGDAVLLSPACASLDMYRNYGHRAEVFADAVRDIGLEAGQPC
jgi:UDP-N-acetylmuramoylalanine--D-glutamate ligase